MKDEKQNGGEGLSFRDLPLEDVVEQLLYLVKTAPDVKWKVRIGWKTGTKSCVGKILGISDAKTKEGTAFLIPVPENIESINSVVKLMAMMTCDKAMGGQDCGTCSDLATCQQMGAIDGSITHMMESKPENGSGEK